MKVVTSGDNNSKWQAKRSEILCPNLFLLIKSDVILVRKDSFIRRQGLEPFIFTIISLIHGIIPRFKEVHKDFLNE